MRKDAGIYLDSDLKRNIYSRSSRSAKASGRNFHYLSVFADGKDYTVKDEGGQPFGTFESIFEIEAFAKATHKVCFYQEPIYISGSVDSSVPIMVLLDKGTTYDPEAVIDLSPVLFSIWSKGSGQFVLVDALTGKTAQKFSSLKDVLTYGKSKEYLPYYGEGIVKYGHGFFEVVKGDSFALVFLKKTIFI